MTSYKKKQILSKYMNLAEIYFSHEISMSLLQLVANSYKYI